MNPILNRNSLPLFEQIKVKHISAALNKVLTENRLLIKKIESTKINPNWENFVIPLQKINEKLSRVWSQINHLNSVINSDELRLVYNKNLNKLQNIILNFLKINQFIKNLKKYNLMRILKNSQGRKKKLLQMKLLDLN